MTIAEDSRDIAQSLAVTAMELATTSPDEALAAITRCARPIRYPEWTSPPLAYLEGGRNVAVPRAEPIRS